MNEAFPHGVNYGCSIERRDTTGDVLVRIVFAIVVGIFGAGMLVHFLAK